VAFDANLPADRDSGSIRYGSRGSFVSDPSFHFRRELLVFGLFVVVAVVSLLPGSLRPRAALIGVPGDNFQHAWFLWHFARAVTHGQNPFFTDLIFYPNRVNLAWSTTDPLAAVLALPFSLTMGPVGAYNVSLVLQLALAGFFAYLLCLRICGDFFAAVVGGVCFGFSPFLIGEALGHLSLVTAFPIPVYLLALDTLLRRADARWMSGVVTGLALFLTALAHYNYTVFCILLTAVVLCVDLAMDRSQLAARVWKPLVTAGATFAALFSPLFWMMWANPAGRPRSRGLDLVEQHSAEVLGWIVPSWNHMVLGRYSRAWNEGLFGAGYEGVVYLGPVILVLAAIGVWTGRRENRRWTTRLFVGAMVFWGLSLGPHIRVWGRDSGVPGPGFLFYFSPFGRFISAPARFHVIAMLCFAALAAMGFAYLMRRFAGVRRSAIAAIICALLLLDLIWVPFPVATSAAAARYRGFAIPMDGCAVPADVARSTVLTVPELEWPYPVRAMWMQVGDAARYALADGYVSYGPDSIWDKYWSEPMMRSLRAVQDRDGASPDLAADRASVAGTIRNLNLGAVVVFDFPRRDATVDYLRQTLASEGERQGKCTIFDLRNVSPGSTANYY
jgi:hypothetical protein